MQQYAMQGPGGGAARRASRAGKLPSPFSARGVYRPQWSGLTDRDAVDAAIAVLDRHVLGIRADWLLALPLPPTLMIEVSGVESVVYAYLGRRSRPGAFDA
jgi:hypothetical protein